MTNAQKELPPLSIVMPVSNEEKVVEKVVRDYCRILGRSVRPEFIIVDDNSSDSTPSILCRLKAEYPYIKIISHPANLGHGPSVVDGFLEARGEYIFQCDSDNQNQAEDFWVLWGLLEPDRLDVAVGFREKRKDPLYRLVLSKMLQASVILIFGSVFRDINSPFRLFRREAAKNILKVIPRRTSIPSILMLLAARELKMRIGEAPVRHLPRTTGATSMRGGRLFLMCREALGELYKAKNACRQ